MRLLIERIDSMLFSAFIFLLLALILMKIEIGRRNGLFKIFLFIFSLQIIVPGIVLPVLIYFSNDGTYLGNIYLDRVYNGLNDSVMMLTALMAVVFVCSLYAGYYIFPSRRLNRFNEEKKQIVIVGWRLFGVVAIGVLSMTYLLLLMPGSSVSDKYFNLVLFRAQHESFFEGARNFVTSNLFSLTQTFAISVTFLFFYLKTKKEKLSLVEVVVVFGLMLFMATFAVSRRISMIQLLVIYFALILKTNTWYFSRIVWLAPVGLFWLGFGKDLMWQIPQYFSVDGFEINLSHENFMLPIIYGFSSLGITLNSSWATLIFLDDLPIRFGVDHLLSALRFLPLGSFGVDEYQLYGPRIVRISTEAFVDSYALDIPPGLMGQMWLDFRIFGPIVWGVVFGVLIKFIQNLFNRFDRTWGSCGIFAVIIFIIALPLNSGSFDFNFSMDMFFLLLFILFMVRIKKFKPLYPN